MKHSISFYLTLFIIKLKGIKKDFSRDPIDYKKIRKEDVKKLKNGFFGKNTSKRFSISNTTITQINSLQASNKLLIFIHGGAFISGPTKLHWNMIKVLSKQTNHIIWLCDYPKAPEHTISEISNNIDLIYNEALENDRFNEITLVGDSVGGTLCIALTQRLIKQNYPLPNKIVLISPVMNATMSNPGIEDLEPIDVMLSKIGVLSAKKMCAENNDLNDNKISPINGDFKSFPKTLFFAAENDIMYPDQKIAICKMQNATVAIEPIIGVGMPHIWPILPVMKEAKTALNKIITFINSN